MEIEKKYLIKTLPVHLKNDLDIYPHKEIKQAYISSSPVIRIRQYGDQFFLTVKGPGLIAREEFELKITEEQFLSLSKKADGSVIHKTRYLIPYESLTIELDLFHGYYDGLIFAEVEFTSLEEVDTFIAPDWFGKDVSEDGSYHNVSLALHPRKDIL